MPQMSNVGKIIVGAVVVVLIVVLLIVFQGKTNQPSTNGVSPAPTPTPGAQAPSQPAQTGVPPRGPMPAIPSPAPARPQITITAPTSSAIWKINDQNTISWSKAGGVSGNIYLVDAQTNKFVGVIIPQTGPQQTYYAWNTRDIFLDRTSPLKKNVVPGTYLIKIAFDGNHLPIITSPAVTITN